MSASAAAASAHSNWDSSVGIRKPCSSASNVNHSLTNPPSGGIAASVSDGDAERQPRSAAAAAPRPPSGSSVRWPVACSTRSTPISASVLARLCAQTCSVAASSPAAARSGLCADWPSSATPRPRARSRRARRSSSRGTGAGLSWVSGVDDAGERRRARRAISSRVAAPGRQRAEGGELEAPQTVEAGATARPTATPRPAAARRCSRPEPRPGREHADLGAERGQEQGEGTPRVPAEQRGVRPDRQREGVGMAVEQPERGEQRGAAELGQAAGE